MISEDGCNGLRFAKIVTYLTSPAGIILMFPFSSKLAYSASSVYKVYFTESEYASLQSDAKGLPLSRFIRKEFLSRKEPVKILVDTDDISFLTMKVSAYTERLNNLIASLALQQQLCESDYEQLLQIASGTEKALRDAANYAKANRTSIRASGERILRKEIQRVLEKLQREEQTK